MNDSDRRSLIPLESTGRLEAFSDGVFAIAITLLVLDLHVPIETPGTSLAQSLIAEWPSYLAFFTSFATIGIMWINHHRLLASMSHADHWLLILNGLLLLGVTIVPFPTSLLADYILKPDANTAAVVYAGAFFFIALTFNLIYAYAARVGLLLATTISDETIRNVTLIYATSLVLYFVTIFAAYYNALLGFGICIALALFYALPPRWNSPLVD